MTTRVLPKVTDTLAEINAVIEGIDNPVHRHMLEVARDHYWGEVFWDVPAIMATLSPTAPIVYRFQGGAFMGLDGEGIESREATQAMYEGARDSGLVIGPMEQLNWTFGPNGVGCEGILHNIFPGSALPGLAEQVDSEKFYLVSFYANTFTPFDEENRYMTGEIFYSGNKPLAVEEVDPAVGKERFGSS